MRTNIVYFDETGDDGNNTKSSNYFVLTSIYMEADYWQDNYDALMNLKRELKNDFGFHVKEEMHTKHFLSDKDPYRKYNWSKEQKREILLRFIKCISSLNIQCVNVIIDKTQIKTKNYDVLKNALTYNIQRIENTSNNEWNYLIITDEGRLTSMRKTARSIRAYNPIKSKFNSSVTRNQPIQNMIEDILDKDSKESIFIQVCDFISYFVHMHYKVVTKSENLPNRIANLIDKTFIERTIITFRVHDILNLKASENNPNGFVIYPK